jgi:hypothetical protein
MVSSRGRFFGAIEVAEGGTIVVASFGLSSSLRKKITRIQEKKKDQGNLKKDVSTLTSQATRKYEGWNP